MALPASENRRLVTTKSRKRYAAISCPRCGVGTLLLIRSNALTCPGCSHREPLPTDMKLHRMGATQLPLTM